MDEYFLQFLWKFQKFTTFDLSLTSGERLSVFDPGHHNQHSGPDFLEGKIKIEKLTWTGSIEVHYKASDWYAHHHQQDKAYENVILHVVWIDDKPVYYPSGQQLPTLVLCKIAPTELELEYRKYINQPGVILCREYLPDVTMIQQMSLFDKAFGGRIQEKAEKIKATCNSCQGDWEETTYQTLGRNFGFKTNTYAFEGLTQSLPFKIIQKHLDHSDQVEALIFGMAGLIKNADDYGNKLSNEFDFLKKKYQLSPVLSRHHWKFSRLRPANFPTIRLAQFIALIRSSPGLFATLLDIRDAKSAKKMISQSVPEYWLKHYDFGKPSAGPHRMGQQSIENVLINSLVPLLAAYGKYTDNHLLLERAEHILESLKPEQNRIIREWSDLGIIPKNAKDSQALLFQYESFCKRKKCLHCNIGLSIIGP